MKPCRASSLLLITLSALWQTSGMMNIALLSMFKFFFSDGLSLLPSCQFMMSQAQYVPAVKYVTGFVSPLM